MKINYNLNKFYLNSIATPFIYGSRHIQLSCNCKLNISLLERISHLALGLLLLFPPFNYLIAYIDRRCHFSASPLSVLHLRGTPYEMGKQHGEHFKKQIHELYAEMLPIFESLAYQRGLDDVALERLKATLPQALIEEIEGLSEGALVNVNDILLMNLGFDLLDLKHFSSAIGLIKNISEKTLKKVATTNHFQSLTSKDSESIQRLNTLLKEDSLHETFSLKQVLSEVMQPDTLLSIIFNAQTGEIQMSTNTQSPAKNTYTKISAHNLFDTNRFFDAKPDQRIKLAGNLDYPMSKKRAEQATLFVRHPESGYEFVTVGFPGIIAPFAGINNQGLCFTSSAADPLNELRDVSPTCFVLLEGLNRFSTILEIDEAYKTKEFSSSMNLALAAKDGIAEIEIDPMRKTVGGASGKFIPVREPPNF